MAVGKPVYNFRSEGRSFESNRCLILADGFYEFTNPEDPKQKLRDKRLFTMAGHRWFCVAGIWRESPVGEAFTMLTIEPGEDVAPDHDPPDLAAAARPLGGLARPARARR